ncbi:iron chelate uptake ABC transporter family permease subunit, partial [Burkholderia cenocepacia]|uniref:iron chelate uptake ABC transporter family permease subunit n=1 Tax=Burkholderia cenocepacia TaxID=95486 RepID=UPI0038CC1D93
MQLCVLPQTGSAEPWTLVAVAAAVTTVVVGFLPFLGIIVPNLVSMVRGDDLRGNLPWVCVVGAGLVILCDIVGRTIVMPFEGHGHLERHDDRAAHDVAEDD